MKAGAGQKRYDVMIAAGGYGRRFSSSSRLDGRPKSLMMGVSRPVIFWTAENALAAGYRRVLVLNNRPEWHYALKEALAPLDSVDVVADVGYASTFSLTKNFIAKMDRRFLFLYGHAPRPVEHLRNIARFATIAVASAFEASTKAKLIPRGRLFLEPPYVIDQSSIRASRASDWITYFEEVNGRLSIYNSSDPSEPNTNVEFEKYIKDYLGAVRA